MSNPSLTKLISLDHSIHLYIDVQLDPSEWLLYTLESPRVGSGRGLAFEEFGLGMVD